MKKPKNRAFVPLFPGLAPLPPEKPGEPSKILACDPGSQKIGLALVSRAFEKGGPRAVAQAWQIKARTADPLHLRIQSLCAQARPIMRQALDAGATCLVIERSAPISRGGKGTGALNVAWVMGLALGAIAGAWSLSGAPCHYIQASAWRSALKGFLVPEERDYKAPAIQLCRTAFGLDQIEEDAAQAVCLGYACLFKPSLLDSEEGP